MSTSPFTFKVSFAPAMTKDHWGVGDDFFDPTPWTLDQIDVYAARNEVAGVQLRLAGSQDFTLVLDRANWLHPLGFLPRLRLDVRFPGLPEGVAECFAVGYVEGDDRRQWMEYLDRAGYAEAPAHRPQAVYMRLRISAEVRKGLYVGQVRLFSQSGFEDETLAWQGGINLHVAAAALPNVKDWSFHLNLWQHLTSIARFHHVALWSEAHYNLIDGYYASLAQLGQKAVSLIATEIPWSGQRGYRERGYPSYLFEHAVIDIRRDPQGGLHFDYAKMDRLLAMAAKHGIDRQIDLFGLVNIWVDEPFGFGKVIADAPDAVRLRCWDAASDSFVYLRQAGELRQFLAALQEHFQTLGLLERVRLEADEPHDLEKFKNSLEFIRQAAPGLRLAVAIDHFEFMEVAPPELLDFFPVLPHLCKDPQLAERLIKLAHARGGRMLFYICCWPPIPNTFVHSPAVEAELLGWLTYFLKVDGFLRWAFCLWPADPWQRVSYRAPDWNAGDMYFVLPGKDGAPVETLRYEGLRAGVQDYELLKLVERTLGPAEAPSAIEKAFAKILRTKNIADFAAVDKANPADLYSLDPLDYQAARQILLAALEPFFVTPQRHREHREDLL
jgi:hypothetical protein